MRKITMIAFLFAGLFFLSETVEQKESKRRLTPHEVVAYDDISAFRYLWRKIFCDFFRMQDYYADLSQRERGKVIAFVRKHQWAPLILQQAEQKNSERIVSFLRYNQQVELPGDNYGKEDPMSALETIAVIKVSQLW